MRRDELIETLWPDTYVTDTNLTNTIVSLRKTLGRDAIQTVSKFGYRFCLPVLGDPGIDQTMYATFIEAKELARVRSLESMARARDLFALCVARDPQFGSGWAWLGRCHRFLGKFGAGSSANMDLAEAMLKRALAIDPNLACAHSFYTQLQVDLGQSQDVIVRLAQRIAARGAEPESFAGLVQGLRFCGLLDESVHHTFVCAVGVDVGVDGLSSRDPRGQATRRNHNYEEHAGRAGTGDRFLLGPAFCDAERTGRKRRPGTARAHPGSHFHSHLTNDMVFKPLRKRADFQRELQRAVEREQEARRAFQKAGGGTILL